MSQQEGVILSSLSMACYPLFLDGSVPFDCSIGVGESLMSDGSRSVSTAI